MREHPWAEKRRIICEDRACETGRDQTPLEFCGPEAKMGVCVWGVDRLMPFAYSLFFSCVVLPW